MCSGGPGFISSLRGRFLVIGPPPPPRYLLVTIRVLPQIGHEHSYADDVNILGGSIHTVKENTESLVVATKEIGLEVNADKTKYMVMSREQTAGLSHTMKGDNSYTERVEELKYLGTTLTNQNSIQEEMKSRLKLGNACYHSVQNLLPSSLLSRNLKIKIYRTIILSVVLC